MCQGTFRNAPGLRRSPTWRASSFGCAPFRPDLFVARAEAPDKPDALGDLRHGLLPVVFVFDGNVALEVLALEFAEDGGNVGHSRAVRQVVRVRFAELVEVFQVAADDPAFENPQAL